MSTPADLKYNWLPMELQLTGYDYESYESQLSWLNMILSNSDENWKNVELTKLKRDAQDSNSRHYHGTSEILSILDQAGWPPEMPKDFLIWDPAELELQARAVCSFLYGKIGAYLYHRHSAELNLFDLCWKDLISAYVRDLPDKPSGLELPEEFTHPEKSSLPKYKKLKESPEDLTARADEYERVRKIVISDLRKNYKNLTDPEIEASANSIAQFSNDLSSTVTDNVLFNKYNEMKRNGANAELFFIAQQSDHPFLRYQFNKDVDRLPDESLGKSHQGISETGLPREIEAKINANLALQLRLKLWWGWPGAPFMCMENMMVDALAYLVREGYLRHLGGMKYELPGDKASAFEKDPTLITQLGEALKLLNPTKVAITAGGALVKGGLSAAGTATAPYWINLGRHLLGI